MGGEFIFKCYAQPNFSEEEIFKLFDLAAAEVSRIEDKFTTFRDSEFNNINKLAGCRACFVDAEVFGLVKRSLAVSKLSKGAFDITYASIQKALRIQESSPVVDGVCDNNQIRLIDYRNIIIDENNQSIFLPNEFMQIGLGGIGKGYAVDKAFDSLKEMGLVNFYVNGSGDIRVHSQIDAPRKWRIGIRNPFSKDPSKNVGIVQLTNGSISTSGSYVKFNPEAKHFFDDHHIINTKTKSSRSEIVSATVLSDDCVTSDTTGTILMTMSVIEALEYLDHNSLLGVVIDKTGRSFLTDNTMKYFGI